MPVGRGGRLPWPRLVKDSGLKVVSLHCDLGSVERSPAAPQLNPAPQRVHHPQRAGPGVGAPVAVELEIDILRVGLRQQDVIPARNEKF